MSAFGKRNDIGTGSSRPNFGVAKPMKGSAGSAQATPEGGEQFPPLDEFAPTPDPSSLDPSIPVGGAMDRLNHRQNQSGEATAAAEAPAISMVTRMIIASPPCGVLLPVSFF